MPLHSRFPAGCTPRRLPCCRDNSHARHYLPTASDKPMPEVTVVIPTHDRAETIMRAVGSVLSQTHSDFELLVIDDGSNDTTPALMAQVADPRLRLLQHTHNRGAAAARNTGIEAACGRFVAFLDSDDEWSPLKLELQLAELKAAP